MTGEVDTYYSDFIVEHRGLRTKARIERAGELENEDEIIVLAPGLASPELGGLRHELAKLGRAAVSFEQPRALPFGWQLTDVAGLRAGVMEKIIDRADDTYGLDKVVLAGHSLGVLDSLQVAHRRGEQISSAEHMAGAGMTDADFCLNAMRLARHFTTEASQSTGYNRAMEITAHTWRNPQQVWLEGVYGSSVNARPILEQQSKDGIDAGWLQFENDLVFPPHVVNHQLAGLAIRKRITEPGETRHGCHVSPLDDPEGTARVLHDILSHRQPDAPSHLQVA